MNETTLTLSAEQTALFDDGTDDDGRELRRWWTAEAKRQLQAGNVQAVEVRLADGALVDVVTR